MSSIIAWVQANQLAVGMLLMAVINFIIKVHPSITSNDIFELIASAVNTVFGAGAASQVNKQS